MFRRRGTFDVVLPALMLLAFSSAAFSADLGKRGKKEYMGACGEADAGLIYVMTNGSNAESCDPDQAVGNVRVYCACDSDGEGGYAWTTLQLASGGGGGSDVDLSDYALLAGDADGQTIQGRSGSDEARVDIGEGQPYEARMIGGGATPAFAFVDNAYFSAQSPDTNSSIQVADGSVQISSDAAVGLSVLPTGAYFGASATSFYAGSPDSTNTIDVSNAAVRILYSQTPPTDADDPCTAGDTIDTATFHYFCAATNTWVRVAMATW